MLAATGLSVGAAAFGLDLAAPTLSAMAAGTYLRPCGDVAISDTWEGHRNRNSNEPGTDYDVGPGTAVHAATNGKIVERKDTTSTATGRYLALQADDGNYIRYLHLSSSKVSPGQRVGRGQLIAYSGASGFDQEHYYGAHVHVSLWLGGTPAQIGFKNTVDFEHYVGSAPTTPPEEPMPIHHSRQADYVTAVGTTEFSRLRFSASEFDMATGAGGSGVYDITTHAYFSGLTPGKELTLQYWLLHATAGNYSFGFEATYPGVPSGEARIEFSTKITVRSGYHLFVAAKCPQGGVTNTKLAKISLNYNTLA